jgi:hypothetical protein
VVVPRREVVAVVVDRVISGVFLAGFMVVELEVAPNLLREVGLEVVDAVPPTRLPPKPEAVLDPPVPVPAPLPRVFPPDPIPCRSSGVALTSRAVRGKNWGVSMHSLGGDECLSLPLSLPLSIPLSIPLPLLLSRRSLGELTLGELGELSSSGRVARLFRWEGDRADPGGGVVFPMPSEARPWLNPPICMYV